LPSGHIIAVLANLGRFIAGINEDILAAVQAAQTPNAPAAPRCGMLRAYWRVIALSSAGLSHHCGDFSHSGLPMTGCPTSAKFEFIFGGA